MFLVGMLSWWYGNGWKARIANAGRQLKGVADFFSIGLLVSTLFSPFRQISAGQVSGPLGVQLRAFFDRLFSRLIGAVIRTLFIIFGIITLAFGLVLQLFLIVAWLIVPILPVAGCILAVIGWVPWK